MANQIKPITSTHANRDLHQQTTLKDKFQCCVGYHNVFVGYDV